MGCQGKTVPGCDQKRHRDDPRQTVCEGVDQAVRENKADQSDKYASKNVYSGMLPEQFARIVAWRDWKIIIIIILSLVLLLLFFFVFLIIIIIITITIIII